MQGVPPATSYECVPPRLIDQMQNAIVPIQLIIVWKIHARVEMPQKPASENRNVEKRCPVARDGLAQHKVKRTFDVGAASRELVQLERLDQRITDRLAGAIEELTLDPGCGFTSARVGVILKRQCKPEEWSDCLRRRRGCHASAGVERPPRSTMSQR